MFVLRKCQPPFTGEDNSNFSTAFVNLLCRTTGTAKAKAESLSTVYKKKHTQKILPQEETIWFQQNLG